MHARREKRVLLLLLLLLLLPPLFRRPWENGTLCDGMFWQFCSHVLLLLMSTLATRKGNIRKEREKVWVNKAPNKRER